jgi:hypothetical protein
VTWTCRPASWVMRCPARDRLPNGDHCCGCEAFALAVSVAMFRAGMEKSPGGGTGGERITHRSWAHPQEIFTPEDHFSGLPVSDVAPIDRIHARPDLVVGNPVQGLDLLRSQTTVPHLRRDVDSGQGSVALDDRRGDGHIDVGSVREGRVLFAFYETDGSPPLLDLLDQIALGPQRIVPVFFLPE